MRGSPNPELAVGSTPPAGRRRGPNPERARGARPAPAFKSGCGSSDARRRRSSQVHPVVLIPLASALGAAALAAAIAARAPGERANRLMAAVLLCDVWWAVFQVLGLCASEPAAALLYARLEMVGSTLLAPVALSCSAWCCPSRCSRPQTADGRVRDRGGRRARLPRQPLARAGSRPYALGLRAGDRPADPLGESGAHAAADLRAVASAATENASACRSTAHEAVGRVRGHSHRARHDDHRLRAARGRPLRPAAR